MGVTSRYDFSALSNDGAGTVAEAGLYSGYDSNSRFALCKGLSSTFPTGGTCDCDAACPASNVYDTAPWRAHDTDGLASILVNCKEFCNTNPFTVRENAAGYNAFEFNPGFNERTQTNNCV